MVEHFFTVCSPIGISILIFQLSGVGITKGMCIRCT